MSQGRGHTTKLHCLAETEWSCPIGLIAKLKNACEMSFNNNMIVKFNVITNSWQFDWVGQYQQKSDLTIIQ